MSKGWATVTSGLVAALALVTGCGGSAGSSSAADTSPTVTGGSTTGGSPATESAGDLTTEAGGTETAGSTANAQPAVSMPGLPIGGDGEFGEVRQCVSVSYLGDVDIPSGVRISVTGASLELIDDEFTDVDDALDGAPAVRDDTACSSGRTRCLSSGFQFTAENEGTEAGTCYIGIRATMPATGGDGDVPIATVALNVDGAATCPDGERAVCDRFAGQVDDDDDTIDNLGVPFAGTTESSSSTSESSSESSSGSSSESTSETDENSNTTGETETSSD